MAVNLNKLFNPALMSSPFFKEKVEALFKNNLLYSHYDSDNVDVIFNRSLIDLIDIPLPLKANAKFFYLAAGVLDIYLSFCRKDSEEESNQVFKNSFMKDNSQTLANSFFSCDKMSSSLYHIIVDSLYQEEVIPPMGFCHNIVFNSSSSIEYYTRMVFLLGFQQRYLVVYLGRTRRGFKYHLSVKSASDTSFFHASSGDDCFKSPYLDGNDFPHLSSFSHISSLAPLHEEIKKACLDDVFPSWREVGSSCLQTLKPLYQMTQL